MSKPMNQLVTMTQATVKSDLTRWQLAGYFATDTAAPGHFSVTSLEVLRHPTMSDMSKAICVAEAGMTPDQQRKAIVKCLESARDIASRYSELTQIATTLIAFYTTDAIWVTRVPSRAAIAAASVQVKEHMKQAKRYSPDHNRTKRVMNAADIMIASTAGDSPKVLANCILYLLSTTRYVPPIMQASAAVNMLETIITTSIEAAIVAPPPPSWAKPASRNYDAPILLPAKEQ